MKEFEEILGVEYLGLISVKEEEGDLEQNSTCDRFQS
jgi:hypothetical protein